MNRIDAVWAVVAAGTKCRKRPVSATILSAFLVLGSVACENFSGRNGKPDSGTPSDATQSKDAQVGTGGRVGSGGQTGGGGSTGSGGAASGEGDGGAPDAPADASAPDAVTPDSGTPDANAPDVGTPDASTPDVAPPAECTAGMKQCNGLQPQTCGSTSMWQNTGAACPFVCTNATGTCTGTCTPGAKKCNGLQPQLCDASGSWQNMGTACSNVCNGGTCAACTAGAKQCNGLQPQLCDAGGLWQNMGTACPFVCTASTGTCTGTCVPGAKRCSASQPQTCDATGTWMNAGAACGACNPCSTATGVCVVATGAACNDNNACTTGETCQSNGTCAAGSAVTCPQPASQCQMVGACVPATGCPAPVNKTGACNDNNACTTGETCQSGTCGGGTVVTCPQPANQCQMVGACVPATGCPAPVNKTGSCNDNNACTTGETCQNGTCGGGSAVTCTQPTNPCQQVGACVPASGCPAPVVQTGAMCMAAVVDPCVITTCQANGTCGGGTPAPRNTPCGNNRFCDGNRMCQCRQPSAGNMLTNPGFDASASPWSLFRASYSEIDVDGCTGSGSINTGSGASVFQCVPVTPSTRYYFYYRFRTSSGSGQAACSLRFYAGGSCTSDEPGTLFSHNAIAPEGGAWAQGRLEALSDSTSSHVYISCAGATTAGFYDQFYLGTTSIPSSMPAF